MKHYKCERHRWIVIHGDAEKTQGDRYDYTVTYMYICGIWLIKPRRKQMKRKEKEGKPLCSISLSLQPRLLHLDKFLDPLLIPFDVLDICRAINTHTEFHQD